MKIFLASHGKFASGLKSSIDILLGSSDKVSVYDAFVDETRLEDVLDSYFAQLSEDEQLVLCSDLYGGSVNQKMALYLHRPNTFLVAGVNLAFLLELAIQSTDLTTMKLEELVRGSRDVLKLVDLEKVPDQPDEFF